MTSPTDASPARTRLARFANSPWTQSFAIAVLWQLTLTVIGTLIDASTHGRAASVGLLGHTERWDALWFEGIIDNGYGAEPASVAFYPAFPLLISILRIVTGGQVGVLVLGLVLNTVALGFAIRALLVIAERLGFTASNRWTPAAMLLTAPPALFCHVFYSESVFLAFAAWAYAFALRRQWALMGLMLVGVTASRLPGLLMLALCGLEFWRSKGWSLRGLLDWRILWLPFGLLGFGAYAVHMWAVFGDPLAMINNVRTSGAWPYHVLQPNVLLTLADQSADVIRAVFGIDGAVLTPEVLHYQAIPLISLLVLAVSAVFLAVVWRRDSIPLVVFSALAIVMYTLNSNVISVHRYVFVCFTIYVAGAALVQRFPKWRPLVAWVMYLGEIGRAHV